MSGERSIGWRGRPLEALAAGSARGVAAAMLGLLFAAGATIVSRRLAGALQTPLAPAMLLAAGVMASAAAAGVRLGWPLSEAANSDRRHDRAVMLLTSLAVVGLAAGLCLPGTPAAGIWSLCVLLIGEESWAWMRYVRQTSLPPIARFPSPVPRHLLPAAIDAETAIPREDVTQQLTRTRAADGVEELSGWLRLCFASGQRTGSIHVAFCPPFATAPELEVEQLDGPEARIKPVQLLSYGARLDLKLAATADEASSVLLQFSARAPAAV